MFNTPPNHTSKGNFWFVADGFATWINGDKAISIWIAKDNTLFPEVNSNIMAVLWIPSKKVNTRICEMKFDTQSERQIVWEWLNK